MQQTTNPLTTNTIPLKDIYLPESVSWWPPAIGWWILLLLLIILGWASYTAIHRYREKWGYRNNALQLLNSTYTNWKISGNDQKDIDKNIIESMAIILKRTAITAYPTTEVSSLFGEQWLEFINKQTKTPCFDSKIKNLLLFQQYQATNSTIIDEVCIDNFYKACQQWIKNHYSHSNNEVNNASA